MQRTPVDTATHGSDNRWNSVPAKYITLGDPPISLNTSPGGSSNLPRSFLYHSKFDATSLDDGLASADKDSQPGSWLTDDLVHPSSLPSPGRKTTHKQLVG